ncbi:MAG: alpha-amylase family glycosyl hydrolase [Anaerolineae bacterium]|nr:alpha-amylase family glycosyl hydrolase [Anaerolineae bacterium]
MNAKHDVAAHPEQAVTAGQINAVLVIQGILHRVIQSYITYIVPDIIRHALERLAESPGKLSTEQTLRSFVEMFPPREMVQKGFTAEEYLASDSNGVPNKEIALVDMIAVWLANSNPAHGSIVEIVDAAPLSEVSAYEDILSEIHGYFDTQPPFGPDQQNLLDMLRGPALAVPHSLTGQLQFIQTRWGYMLQNYLYQLLTSIDLIREEKPPQFTGPGPSRVLEFITSGFEPEHYSPDQDWMPQLTVLAKNAYVWLDQLSKSFNRPITRLDQIPDEVLDETARRGFTGLWLIGLWKRSEASKRVKQMRGNPDAVASAYSIFDYRIADELGGEQSYQEFRSRAQTRGIRLASDMVPNHMGIDSPWVMEHPDWFIALEYSPYPCYTFNGPNLSWNQLTGIYLEDHYYDYSDAAVVFKRVDHRTGEERYIYHGNDGTSMPWNDTAQLNYLKPEAREAVIQTILQVAKKFSIIRFDAAMTLAKKHYQRLWFPEPGEGGGIPSRAEHSMSKRDFDNYMPVEFWREVVDRVQEEAPDTLLLAEAFWLMEGYFVRSLGMHRVYNSAFMNMLRDEDNAKYRTTIRNTLEFDPQILKRYVNFMNNPDERTAVDQFGTGDKYFGICTLLVTMPGLPMFGHGQIEGFAEKYGMEYQRAYLDEKPNQGLIDRHGGEIFPLIRRRDLFADVTNFLLYDFCIADDEVNEDVFAYSNRAGSARALIIYNNRYAETRGWIHTSVPYVVPQDNEKPLVQTTLIEGLDITPDEDTFVVFRDHTSGLEYIRNTQVLAEKGLYIELVAYECHVFLDFRQVENDRRNDYTVLAESLQGCGVRDLDEALREILLVPIHEPLRVLASADLCGRTIGARTTATAVVAIADEFERKALRVLEGIRSYQSKLDPTIAREGSMSSAIAGEMRQKFEVALGFPHLREGGPVSCPTLLAVTEDFLNSQFTDDPATHAILLGWLCTHELGRAADQSPATGSCCTWHKEWLLDVVLADLFRDSGLDEHAAERAIALIRVMTRHQEWYRRAQPAPAYAYDVLAVWLVDEDIQTFLCFNQFDDILWFNEESFDTLCWWMFSAATITICADPFSSTVEKHSEIEDAYRVIRELRQAEALSGYRIEKLLEVLKY